MTANLPSQSLCFAPDHPDARYLRLEPPSSPIGYTAQHTHNEGLVINNFVMADDGSKWLRKATDVERFFEIAHQKQIHLIHYTLDLASARPLDEGFFRKALTHLYWKVPVLRVCLRERDSELWLLEMEKCNIDLKIIVDRILEDEQDKLTLHTYNSNDGPLWCVRILPLERTSQSLEDIQKEFPHHYALIFGIHHSVSDGTTNVKICNLLCNIMNDLLGGLVIDDNDQLGEITSDVEVLELYDEELVRLKENPELCAEIKRELEGAKVRPLIRHVCKVPADVPVMTKSVTALFNSEISNRFYMKAKSKGVSLHSALATLINLSFVKILQEHGINQDEYNFRTGHDINIRRYFSSENSSRSLGINVPLFGYRSQSVVPNDLLPIFWETAKQFNEKFQADLSSRKVLTYSAYRIMNGNINQNFKEILKADGDPDYYYTISNMGNLSGVLYEEDQNISLKKLTRFCSLRNGTSFLCIFIHTFRSQLNLTFAYSTQFLTREFVRRLVELFELHLPLVCEV
ncbi:uncharacterized protein [Palaemon carinicauda]|uniref:uncharacterized protein n=1 Tax=Palaemon carinicauda TaxID=392227 RepID=UPI0035B5D54D